MSRSHQRYNLTQNKQRGHDMGVERQECDIAPPEMPFLNEHRPHSLDLECNSFCGDLVFEYATFCNVTERLHTMMVRRDV